MYVLPMEKRELDLVTSISTLSSNVLLHDYTCHEIPTAAIPTVEAYVDGSNVDTFGPSLDFAWRI
jgi:hypothetical protein